MANADRRAIGLPSGQDRHRGRTHLRNRRVGKADPRRRPSPCRLPPAAVTSRYPGAGRIDLRPDEDHEGSRLGHLPGSGHGGRPSCGSVRQGPRRPRPAHARTSDAASTRVGAVTGRSRVSHTMVTRLLTRRSRVGHALLTRCSRVGHALLTRCSRVAHALLTRCSRGAHAVLTRCSRVGRASVTGPSPVAHALLTRRSRVAHALRTGQQETRQHGGFLAVAAGGTGVCLIPVRLRVSRLPAVPQKPRHLGHVLVAPP